MSQEALKHTCATGCTQSHSTIPSTEGTFYLFLYFVGYVCILGCDFC